KAAAIAISNNDVVQLFWRQPQAIDKCLGFAIYRKENSEPGPGQGQALPAWVPFKGQTNPTWTPRTTAEWPIQKFEWRDLTAKRGKTYWYRIVPMLAPYNNLKPDQA